MFMCALEHIYRQPVVLGDERLTKDHTQPYVNLRLIMAARVCKEESSAGCCSTWNQRETCGQLSANINQQTRARGEYDYDQAKQTAREPNWFALSRKRCKTTTTRERHWNWQQCACARQMRLNHPIQFNYEYKGSGNIFTHLLLGNGFNGRAGLKLEWPN